MSRERLDKALGEVCLDEMERYGNRAPTREEFVGMIDVVLDELVRRMREPEPEPPKDPLIGRRMRYTQPLGGLRSRYVTVLEINAREALVESEFGNLWVRRDSLAEIR